MYYDESMPHEVKLTPKENYFRVVDGLEPEYMPAFFTNGQVFWDEDFLTPMLAPEPVKTKLGVTYVGTKELNYGAMPQPNVVIIDDITKWRDQFSIEDFSDFDFESYYHSKVSHIDRESHFVVSGGADYFLTLVSLLGFENTLLSLFEEPEATKELLDYIHGYYMFIYKKQLEYVKPEMLSTMDDICSQQQPFFSLDMYREFFKPLEKEHYDLALDRGMRIAHHCCGHCEMFLDDWIEMGVQVWNPAQVFNDLVGIKAKYGHCLTIEGAWDEVGFSLCDDEEELREGVRTYVDTFAPGGRFDYLAVCSGNAELDPKVKWRNDICMDMYRTYAFDWYKNQG